jgi:hypothetical protein
MWARHIYLLLKQFCPDILKNPEFIIAYNKWTARLEYYQNDIITIIPYGIHKYRTGVDMYAGTLLDSRNIRYTHALASAKLDTNQTIYDDILSYYIPLYTLFETTLMPQILYIRIKKERTPLINVYKKLLNKYEMAIYSNNIKYLKKITDMHNMHATKLQGVTNPKRIDKINRKFNAEFIHSERIHKIRMDSLYKGQRMATDHIVTYEYELTLAQRNKDGI